MSPVELGGAITGVCAALAALGWAARTLARIGRRVADLHDDWQGEQARPGVPARKGVMERLSTIEADLTQHLEHHSTSAPVQVNVTAAPAPIIQPGTS